MCVGMLAGRREWGLRRKKLNHNDFRKQRVERNMPLNSAHSCTSLSII